jgi:hypothetical protein
MGQEEREPKLFSLSEAERARRQVEPLLIEAMEGRRKMADLEENLSAISNRIQIMGGIMIDYDVAARMRNELNGVTEKVRDALDQIHAKGCLVKDLDSGLVDFPSVIKNEEVFLCWRLGEDRIRFYHRQDEGFAGRKPIDPDDTGPQHPIQ